DTFGLVLLEAIACGLPVAAYPVPGPKDVIGATGAGILAEDLRQAALGALAMGQVEPGTALRDFSWKACADIFESILTAIGATRGVPARGTTSGKPVSAR
ncbi:MAG: glycosyltransferase, partial [Phyllobacterium sp.]